MKIYKIFAKTLQLRLQPILRDVISPEQTVFLSLWFILDNIVLTHEALHWTKESRQPTVFLKLDFSKAYNKIFWNLFFKQWMKMGINKKITRWLKLLFGNTTAIINLNRSPSESFRVEKGVR